MMETSRDARSKWIVRGGTLKGKDQEADPLAATPGERLAMMWQLTLDSWAFMGKPLDESRLPRHVVRVLRRGR